MGYKETEIKDIDVIHSFLNKLLSYDEWWVSVTFADETEVKYNYGDVYGEGFQQISYFPEDPSKNNFKHAEYDYDEVGHFAKNKVFQADLSSYINRNNLTVVADTENENSYTFLYKKQNEIGVCTFTYNKQQKHMGQSCSNTTENKTLTLLVTNDENSNNSFVSFAITDEQLLTKAYKAEFLFEAKKISLNLDNRTGIVVNAPTDVSKFEKIILYDKEGTILLSQSSDLSFQEVEKISYKLIKLSPDSSVQPILIL
jgi:hypothetical protein